MSSQKLNPINILLRYYWLLLFVGIISVLFYWLWQVWLPFVLSLIMAYLLNPIVNYFEKKMPSRTHAVSVVYIIITIVITLSIIFLAPVTTAELHSVRTNLPEHISVFKQIISTSETKLRTAHPYFNNIDLNGGIVQQFDNFMDKILNDVPLFLEHIFEWMIMILLIPLITFFFLQDGYKIKKQFIELVPNKYFEMIFGLIFRLDQQLGNYIKGKLWQTIILSVFVSGGLMAINTPYALLLGTFAGITHLVPYVGPLVGIVPIFIVVFFTKKTIFFLAYIGILFLIEQLIDHILLIPLIVGKSIDMHPLIVILSLSIGGYAAGIWGMLLGVPIAGMLQVIIQELNKEIKFRLYSDSIETDRIELYDPKTYNTYPS